MQKTMYLVVGIVILLSAVIIVSADNDANAVESSQELFGIQGMGTESDPYQIDSADDLNVIDELSSSMRNGMSISVVLVDDIDITGVDPNSTGAYIDAFRGTFDGNGHTIEGSNVKTSFIFYYTYGETIITDFVLETDSVLETVCVNSSTGTLEMSYITVNSCGTGDMTGNNFSPFIGFTFGNLTLKDCTNNADLILGRYGAVFLGGYPRGDISVTFDHCVNNGAIFGESPSLFLGNPWQTRFSMLTIVDCENNNDIIGTSNAKYIAALSGNGYGNVFDDLNEACENGNGTVQDGRDWESTSNSNYAHLGQYSIEAVSGNGKVETQAVDITIARDSDSYTVTTTSQDAAYAVFNINAYAQGNGTSLTYIYDQSVTISNGSAIMNMPVGMLTTYDLAKMEYGLVDVSPTGTTANGYDYYHFEVGGVHAYAVDFGDSEWTLNDVTTINVGVTIYSENGDPIGYRTMSVTVEKPKTTSGTEESYHKVYIQSEGYIDIVVNSRYVANGSTLEFQLIPAEGYSFSDNVVVSAYTTYDVDADYYEEYDCKSLGDGRYRISNVSNDVYIQVNVSDGGVVAVSHDVVYDLSNVISSSSASSLSHNAPFVTTLSPVQGYDLDDVRVYMGGEEVYGAYDASTGKVSIRYVTGDVVIVADASYTYIPLPDDDDDYVPIPPVVSDENNGDDTVTIVACAAAAVVAAIMAVFLILERKR